MTKAKKTKVPVRKTALDQLVTKLRAALRRETTNIIEIGKLLIESREHLLDHGEWQTWIVENSGLSIRTAQNYRAAAEYVASKSATVADFKNIAATVLYALANGCYNEQEEAAILAATRERRVDQDAALAICEELAPADDDDTDDIDVTGIADDQEHDGEAAAEDPKSAAILDGPPPDLQSAPAPAPPNFALRDFDQAVTALKRLMTKPSAQFINSIHSSKDLEHIENFIHAVADQAREALRKRAS